MGIKRRCDGTLLTDIPAFRKINPFVMRGRNEATVYSSHEAVLTKTLDFIRRYNRSLPAGQPKLAPFHVLLCAIVRTMAFRPQLNRFISGFKVYQRNRIQISFIIKKQLTDDGDEANAKITFSPYETVGTIVGRINDYVKHARFGSGTEGDKEVEFFARFPRFVLNAFVKGFKILDYYSLAPKSMIESDPLYTSIYLANLGSLGLDAPFHHMYEWGNASLFVAIGRIKKETRLQRDGSVKVEDVVRLNVSFDDRISEGIYCARGVELFRKFIEDPECLLVPPEIPEELLKEHRFAEKYEALQSSGSSGMAG